MIKNLFEFVKDLVEESPDPASENNEHAIALAAAALMLEVARADEDKQAIEIEAIASVLATDYSLSEEEVSSLISAADQEVEAATDLFQFTQLINDAFDYAGKRELIAAMWRVAFADGRIEAFEDHIIRRVAGLLHVAHHDLVRLKIEARNRQPSAK